MVRLGAAIYAQLIRTIAYCEHRHRNDSFASKAGGMCCCESIPPPFESAMPYSVPIPKDPNLLTEQFDAFVAIVRLLRQECPWDRQQTHSSIAHLLIEESYETLDAIERADDAEFKKELGDLLLHVVMHSVIAEERNAFTLNEVIEHVAQKLVRRHPHVFGDVVAENPSQVMQNWERLKLSEGSESILAGVPRHLPALLRAQRMQEKAANVGFDWRSIVSVWEKVGEELAELRAAADSDDRRALEEEFGDFLFAMVNLARHWGIVAETALQRANEKFRERFQYIEEQARKEGSPLEQLSLEQMDQWWNHAKQQR